MAARTKTTFRNATKSQAILRAAGLSKTYHMGGRDLEVLRGVDLSIKPGEWLAVLGASGSGKSTLLHLLGGLDHPDRGQVIFHDQDVLTFSNPRLDKFRNKDVGFVFQFYHLLPELSAQENVFVGAMIRHSLLTWPQHRASAQNRAKTLLDRMGMTDRLSHQPGKLSGGERQRVAIARALINDPAVLLADEPTGNLDVETGQQIMSVFQQLHQDGQTIVMVTHDDKVAAYADRQLTLENGRLK